MRRSSSVGGAVHARVAVVRASRAYGLMVLCALALLGCSGNGPSEGGEPLGQVQEAAISTTAALQDDSYIISSSVVGTTSNTTGGSPVLMVGARVTTTPSSEVFRSLLKFNLTGIPSGATVTSATLTLQNITPAGMATNNPTNPTVRVFPVSSSWTEDTTKGVQPAGGGQARGVACLRAPGSPGCDGTAGRTPGAPPAATSGH